MLSRLTGRPVSVALVATIVGVPTYVLGVQAIRRIWLPDVGLLQPVPVILPRRPSVWDIGLDPASLDLTGDLLYSATALLTNFGLLLSVSGLLTLGFYGIYFKRVTVANAIRVSATLLAIIVAVALLALSPTLRLVVVEGAAFTFVTLATAGLAGLLIFGLFERLGTVGRVVILGPLVSATVFFALVAGSLATPTLAGPLRDLTAAMVRFILLEILSVGGLNRVLVSVFELDGTGVVVFWAGVNAVLGWTLALVLLVRERRLERRPSRG